MKKKILILILAILSFCVCILEVAACGSNPQQSTEVAVTSIYLDSNSLTIKTEETKKFIATVRPANATDKTVTWESSAPLVVSVSADGTVTGVKEGSARIFATSSNGLEAVCSVTVIENTHGFVYAEYESGYAVVGYNGGERIVNVPTRYKGKDVIAIGNITDKEVEAQNIYNLISESDKVARGGFYNNASVEKIILPQTIIHINAYAFAECKKLTNISINEGVLNIGYFAFENCGVQSLSMPSTLERLEACLLGSNINTLELASINGEHFTDMLGAFNRSIFLNVEQLCYWRGTVDSHFEVTEYSSKTFVQGSTSGSSVTGSLVLYYPIAWKLVNRWFNVETFLGTYKCFSYGKYEVSTSSARVTEEVSGKGYQVSYKAPSAIKGEFFMIPSTLERLVVKTHCEQSYVEGLDIEICSE